MNIVSAYSVKIKHYNHIFADTVQLYRKAVDYFISVANRKWEALSLLGGQKMRVNAMERLTISTAKNPNLGYHFSERFYKFPSYLRRAAIMEALGKVSSKGIYTQHMGLDNGKLTKVGRGLYTASLF